MTTVVLADDQRVVREGLATLLGLLPGIEVVGTASDGEEAVQLVERLRPEIVLMDIRMPRCDGVEATRRLRERGSSTHVIVLTTYADDRSVIEALRAGARGFLTKDSGAEEIERAIAAVARGEAAIDPAVQHHLVEAVAAKPELPHGLTPREAEVLGLIAQGLSNAEIAGRLFVSDATVKSRVNHLFAKTGVRDRAQAIAYAYGTGSPARSRGVRRSRCGRTRGPSPSRRASSPNAREEAKLPQCFASSGNAASSRCA